MNERMKLFDKADSMRDLATKSRKGELGFEAIPFHWEFEEFCKNNGIRCTYHEAIQEYSLNLMSQLTTNN